MRIVDTPLTKSYLETVAKEQFGNLVKAVVDIERKCMAVGGDLHADEEALLLENGSEQNSVWGINLRLDKTGDDWIEFDSMINVRPSQGNFSRNVESQEVREKITHIVNELIS